tara:strand:+ start:169 stop:846 length:678 start_codon:yes stop_codon:yes gene_type:complete
MRIEYKTQDVLAVAFRAFKINNGYIKDTKRFSEPMNKTVFSNKDLVKFQMRPEFRPPDFEEIDTDTDDYNEVDNALKHFRRYTFGMLGESLSDFQKDVISNVWSEKVEFNKLGILAYVPALVQREIKENNLKKVIRIEYRNSAYIGDIGESVEGVCKILHRHYSSHYERYKYTADYMGNIIGFWNKFDIPEGDRRKFKGKVKAHDKNRLFEVNETSINYVKIYKV